MPYSAKVSYFSLADTIIHLDSVKDRKLLKKKPILLKDTVNIRGRKGSSDTSKKGMKTLADTSKKSKQGFQSEIKYTSKDSSRADNVNKVLYLWGNARITYDDVELDADYIRVDQKNHLIYASGLPDPRTKKYGNRPIFKQKDDKPLVADSLTFNYVTKKGKIYNAASEQDGNFISGGTAKRLNEEEVAYKNVLFSTCDLPYPDTHFGIVITKGIAEKHRIISGPAYLEIEGVPLPLFIPFGFFPKPDQRSSGVILPTFGEDTQLGFYLKGFGYYLGLSDYMDLTTTGSYYTKGSFDISSTSRYLKKYKYQGNLTLSYGSHKYGLETDPPQKDFNIQWSHSQDPAAHPGTTFSASVNAGTSSFYQNSPAQTNYNIQALTQNTLSSSIAYGKTWAGSPFNLTANISHRQDITRKTITLELPSFSLNMATLSPFDSKDRVGEQKWYQRITVGYSLQGTNKVNDIPESELFKSNTLSKRFQNGFTQQIPVSLSLNILKYFQFSSSVSYTERDYFQTIRKHYARGSISGVDDIVIDTVQGFKRAGEYSLSSGFSTKLYSTVLFKKGRLKAIRQVITPNIGFSYRPDFSDPKYGYYNTIVSNATIPYPYTSQKYSIFEQSVYGGPGGGKQASINFSLDNTIEAKMAAKSSDTSGLEKKIPILQGLSLSGSYNLIADSMKLSTLGFQGRTSLFNQKLGINFGGTLNPYVNQVRDSISNGQITRYARLIDRYTWQDGKFPTLTQFNLSMDISLNSAALKHPSNAAQQQQANTLATMTPNQADRLALINSNPNAFVDFNIPWNVNLSYSFYYTNTGVGTTTSNTLNLNGDINVTSKWKLQYTSGFDLKQGKVSTTSLSIYRDLHCWDMSFQWIPFGFYKFYSVDLKVKASILQDLKLSKRKDYYNNN